jgi:hypothetical protein
LPGCSGGEEHEPRGFDPKRKEAKSETLEPDICDDDHARLDRFVSHALEEFGGSAAKRIEWLDHREHGVADPLPEPCAMFRFTDEREVTAAIEFPRFVDRGLDTVRRACHEHEDAGRRAM